MITTFDTPGPIAVTIEIAYGSVRVRASERDDTRVTVPDEGPEGAPSKARVELVGDQLLVKGPPPRALGWALDWLRRSERLDVEIELPAGSRIHGKVTAGDYQCDGPLGECRLLTTYGDIRFDGGGPVQLTTRYGEINVEHAVGRAELSAVHGDVRVGVVDGSAVIKNHYGETRVGTATGDVRLEGVYGEIRLDHAEAAVSARTAYGSVRIKEVRRGTVELTTTSGDLDIGIRAGTAAWLDVSTASGKVRNTLDAQDSPDGFSETVEIHARASGGNILIHRS